MHDWMHEGKRVPKCLFPSFGKRSTFSGGSIDPLNLFFDEKSMSPTSINLLVLRVCDINKGADFYSALGIEFTKHSHGKGPEHYAAEMGNMVFELYPQTSDVSSTKYTRIGFKVVNATDAIKALVAKGGKIVSELKESPWGLRAVVDDPFGHRIEITEPK
ncbi:MAG: VOC family protein [Kiritimatiellae bacterium]|nr:VOC family protein [Kiritimatiellia bacterium]